MESAADVPRLLAAIGRALELTDPFTNPTKGGTFLAAVGMQVREAILAELADDDACREHVMWSPVPGDQQGGERYAEARERQDQPPHG